LTESKKSRIGGARVHVRRCVATAAVWLSGGIVGKPLDFRISNPAPGF